VLSVWGGFRKRVYTSLAGLTLMGGGFTMVGLAPATAFWLALVGNFLAGFMNPIANGPLFAVLQATVTPGMQGRVFTVISSLTSAMAPISLAVAGPIADIVGVRAWYVVGGLTCVVLGVGAASIPAIANLEHDLASGQVQVK
ncbi:MAG: MFS transporter, partial [Anaerolineae bacterium]|nr:MFS transporter [Anaerolineae bacterium]